VRSRSQGLIVAALCAIALFAAWRIVSLAIADFYADSDPARALQWRPAHPDALLMLAEKNVAGRKFDAAEALAKRALAANPLDGRAYRVLADAASARGDRKRQQTLIALAVQHAPRDIAARAWAAQIALERGRRRGRCRALRSHSENGAWSAGQGVPSALGSCGGAGRARRNRVEAGGAATLATGVARLLCVHGANCG
jgi:tetratricopeptide (TPR) repeat protein